MWATFDYDGAPYLIATYKDVTDAALACSRQGYGHVVFLRQNMEFKDSIDWYLNKSNENEWAKLRMAVIDGFTIGKEGGANLDQLLDIITNKVWMQYLNHEVGLGPTCESTQTDPVDETSEAGPGTT